MTTNNKNFKVKNGLEVAGEIGVGATPSYGTTGQILSSQGAGNAAAWIDVAPAASYTSVVKHDVRLAEAITKGQAVYVSSSNGSNIVVSKASNASEATSSKTLGLLESSGSTNNQRNVVTEGLLGGIDVGAAAAGDPVWLGTSGNLIYGLTNKPIAPAHLVFIGIVTRDGNNGEIFVRIQNGFELNEIHNVLIGTDYTANSIPADNEFLAYNLGTNLWINQTAEEAGVANLSGATFTGNVAGTNGSFSGNVSATSFTVPTIRTNLVTNPNFESNLTHWTSDYDTLSRVNTTPQSGSWCARVDYLDGSNDANYSKANSLVVGETYTISVWVRCASGTQTIGVAGYIGLAGATGAVVGDTTWRQVTIPNIVAGNTFAQLYITGSDFEPFFIDSLIIEKSSTYSGYFDGNTTDAGGVDYAWTGTANASTSTATGSVGVANLSGATFTGNIAGTNISLSGNVNAVTVNATTLIGNTNASTITTGTIANARTTASDANGASTIVSRNATGNFTANVITASTLSGPLATTARLELSKTAGQNLTDGTITLLTFPTTVENIGGYTISSGTITVPLAGRYSITAYVAFPQAGTNRRNLFIYKGATDIWQVTAETTSEAGGFKQMINVYSERLAANDTISIRARQDSGGTISVDDAKLIIDYIGK